MLLLQGDCLEQMKTLEDNSVDSIVTDPPYGLAFMGKKWDYEVPSVEIWKEALRVLKPGGHLLSFGGTRTYHRMVVNIEDAGFEIRDCIQWLYGSGFPKSHNLKEQWQGWGTALKPANEPIVVARKPLEKGLTVAENVLKYGTGAINIDGSRIGTESLTYASRLTSNSNLNDDGWNKIGEKSDSKTVNGRWPANIILDEAAAEMLDEQSRMLKSGELKDGASRFFYVAKASKSERNAGLEGMPLVSATSKQQNSSGRMENGIVTNDRPDEPRQQNFHPTVKPIKLMQYLINLVTPPNGTVLDPFMGSGSTGVAAKNLNRQFIGIELSEEYFEICKKRINNNSQA